MIETADNLQRSDGAVPWGRKLDPSDDPRQLAARLASDRDQSGKLREHAKFVMAPPRRHVDELAELRRNLQHERFEDAVKLTVAALAPQARNEQVRRVVFGLMQRPYWRRRLMPELRRLVIARRPDPVPGGLFLYGRMLARRQPDPHITSPLLWALSQTWLLDHCAPEDMLPCAQHLARSFPEITFLAEFLRGIENSPPAPAEDSFRDHWNAEVQLVRSRRGPSGHLLICFTGMYGRMGTPIGLFDRWPAQLPVHVLYLRDLKRRYYRNGIATLGPGSDRLHSFLRGVAAELGVAHVTVYGISMGGVPAVKTALAIGAERVVWAAGAIERGEQGVPWNDPGESRRRHEAALALLDELNAAARPPEIACIFGEQFDIDAEMPRTLASHPRVSLHPLKGLTSHNIDFHLVKAGRFDKLIAWASGGTAPLQLT